MPLHGVGLSCMHAPSTVQNSVPAPYPPPMTQRIPLSPQTNPRSVGSQHIISSLAVQSLPIRLLLLS
ncbi:hypothetical protein CPC08DRAFT_385420 [Agrocybe pediades]|nr:hypothetical protein CPC08DRAFT_385420 [Agrocybe pediades]